MGMRWIFSDKLSLYLTFQEFFEAIYVAETGRNGRNEWEWLVHMYFSDEFIYCIVDVVDTDPDHRTGTNICRKICTYML